MAAIIKLTALNSCKQPVASEELPLLCLYFHFDIVDHQQIVVDLREEFLNVVLHFQRGGDWGGDSMHSLELEGVWGINLAVVQHGMHPAIGQVEVIDPEFLQLLVLLVRGPHRPCCELMIYKEMQQYQKTEQRVMAITCEQCKQQPQCPLWCLTCEEVCCPNCYSAHSSHESKIQFMCQQCQEIPETAKTVFCESCEQHLCPQCSEKIHNKGKRAKHVLHNTSTQTMKIKRVYIACEDVIGYYGYINYGALFMDLADSVPEGEAFLLMLEKNKDSADIKSKLQVTIKPFNSQKQFGEEFCTSSKLLYPFLQQIVFIESHRSCKLYDSIKQTKSVKTTLHRLGEVVQKPVHNIASITMSSISIQNSSLNNKSNISAKYPRESRNHLSMNISTSTENSLRKRKRKSPILYFHPFTCLKGDKRCSIENYYRELASKGTLMVRREHCKNYEEGILRAFYRNIGETEVEYVSLLLDTISIECLYWVIRSIQEDLMAPTEKLILSRLKESFDIKVHSKLWNYIMKYLSSCQYENDRLEVDPIGNIPRLLVKPFNSEDSYILYCKSDNFTPVEWPYEDLSKLNESSLEWKQFIELIDQFFQFNSQIGGGRYGCVQYIKFNAKKPLKDCSLGKLSMFVQEAINKGIIRYHKTLLVSNRENDESQTSQARTDNKQGLPQIQKNIKIMTLQLLLLDNFRQYGEGVPISLAQIPQNLRKSAPFEINYVELGFPKLKNFLVTLSSVIQIELSKSHIIYGVRPETDSLIKQKRERLLEQTNHMIEQTIKELVDIIDSSKLAGMALEQLYNQLNIKTGLVLDFLLFNMADFCQFVAYYGQNYFEIQMHMRCLVVYKKWQKPIKSQQTSTPTFKETEVQYKFKNLQNFEWCETNNNWLDEGNSKGYGLVEKEQEQENQSESFSDYKSIYNLIDDDSQSKSFPKTVIIKQNCTKYGNNTGLLVNHPIEENTSSKNSKNEESISEMDELSNVKVGNTNKGQHNRMYSNNIQQRTNHYRVYSNMSRH